MHALELSQLTKTYKNGVRALKGIDLCVESGDFYALLGPNGAGKSTTIGIITSLVTKSSGSVKVFGHDLDREPIEAKSAVGVVPQELNFSQFESPLEICTNQGGFYGIPFATARERAETYLNRLELWDKRNEASRTLSGGMKRRLMIARALVHEPRLLILDEPTAGVDIEIRRAMWQFLEDLNATQGTTIILTTHYLDEAERLCRNIGIIDDGLIVEDTSMKNLLATLNTETFVLDLNAPCRNCPDVGNHVAHLLDDTTLEIEVNREEPLNDVFRRLSEQGINILSMRNKTNRLEELFLHLVEQRDAVAEGHGDEPGESEVDCDAEGPRAS